MKSGRIAIAALSALFALSIHAGLSYRFTSTSNASLGHEQAGRVWIDGDRRRVELDPDPENPRTFDVSITRDGKTTFINLQNKTWFGETAHRVNSTSSLFHLPMNSADSMVGKPLIGDENAGAGPAVGEHATTKHRIRLRYRIRGDIRGTGVRAVVDATVTFFTAAALPRIAGSERFVRTGFAQADGELDRIFASTAGMIVGWEVTVTRTLEGAQAFTETTTMAIEELKNVAVDDVKFTMPAGLKFQEPVYGIP